MITICINDALSGDQFISGATLAEAARKAVQAREGTITAQDVTPLGGTHYHIVNREIDPEGFWTAQLTHSMNDNENWGWGETEAAALAHAHPEVDEA